MPHRTDRLFAALGNWERLQVLRVVMRNGPITGLQIQDRTGYSQENVSRYLKILEAEGLIERGGRQRAPYFVPLHRETRALLLAAGRIHEAHLGESATEARALIKEMEKLPASPEEDAAEAKS
jgi:DNA-binding MarR family transcriptional regulator